MPTMKPRRSYLEEGEGAGILDEVAGIDPKYFGKGLVDIRNPKLATMDQKSFQDTSPDRPLPPGSDPKSWVQLLRGGGDAPLMRPGDPGYPDPQDLPTGDPAGELRESPHTAASPSFLGQEFDPFAPSKPPPSDYDLAIDAKKKLLASQPVQSDPKWWQRALAGVAGGAAGWENATGRTRPIDVGALSQSILHPGYEDKLKAWQSRVAPAEALIGLEGKKVAASNTERELQRKEALESAQAGYYKAHGDYMEGLGRQPNQWKIDPNTGTFYNAQTGEQKTAPPTPQDRARVAKLLPGVTDDMAAYYALNGNLAGYGGTLASPKAENEWAAYMTANGNDPKRALAAKRQDEINRARESRPERLDPDRQRPMSAKQKTAIEEKHQDAYRKLASELLLRKSSVSPEDLADYERQQKQLIEDGYAAELSAATGDYIPAYDFNRQQPPKDTQKKDISKQGGGAQKSDPLGVRGLIKQK